MQDTKGNETAAGERLTSETPWDRVMVAPAEGWVEAEAYDTGFTAKEGIHVTELLWARQVDAGAGKTFHATARRLETPWAVQHESQWRMDIDARRERVTLHWLRVVRGGEQVDQLGRGRMRLMQRETQLDHHVIDGLWTLLIVLEDVRPGDVIEAGWTVEWVHPIRPEGCEVFFVVPPQATVARYRLAVAGETAKGVLRWKASGDAPEMREETGVDGRRRLIWEGVQAKPREPEPNQPTTFLDFTWVQVSDLADWSELSARVERVWSEQADTRGAEDFFAKPEVVDAAAVLGLVRRVQDEFRYLSTDLETSGWIPASPGVVARRRHGDCKDLSWLTTSVLRSWGVKARPVLVNSQLRERVARLLPMAGLLNHAVVEVEWKGVTRWFDPTARDLGGSFKRQVVGWFGQGLVIEGEGGGLVEQPGARTGARYELRETVLLDTTQKAVSVVEVRLRAEGWQADNFRRELLEQGPEIFTKQREEQARNRYGRVHRVGEPKWRDDREGNVFELVEVFEVLRAAYPDSRWKNALFDVPLDLIMQVFPVPGEAVRRGPWALPYPFEVAHEIMVKTGGFRVGWRPRKRWSEPEFRATVEGKHMRGGWINRARLVVDAPEVSAERAPWFRLRISELFREFGWRLYLPWGQARRRSLDVFGELGKPGMDLVSGARLPEPKSKTLVEEVEDEPIEPVVREPIVVEISKDSSNLGARRRRRTEAAADAEANAAEGRMEVRTDLGSKIVGLLLMVIFITLAVLVAVIGMRE